MFGLSLPERAGRLLNQTIQALPPYCDLRSTLLSNKVEFEVFSMQMPMQGLTLLQHQAFAAARYRNKIPSLNPSISSAALAVGMDELGKEIVRISSWIDDRTLLGIRIEGIADKELRRTLGHVVKVRTLEPVTVDEKLPSDEVEDPFIGLLRTRLLSFQSRLHQGLIEFRMETPNDESILELAGERYVIVGQNDPGDYLVVKHGGFELIKLGHDPLEIQVLGITL